MPENCFNNAYMGHEGSHLFFKGGNSDKRLSSSWGFHVSPSYLPIRKAEVQCRVNIKYLPRTFSLRGVVLPIWQRWKVRPGEDFVFISNPSDAAGC